MFRSLRRAWAAVALALVIATLGVLPRPAAAQARLDLLDALRTDDGVLLAYDLDLVLRPPVEEALHKGVPLTFVVEAALYRSRWYWRDVFVAGVRREWRLSYQPLTRQYRLSFEKIAQTHDTLASALAVLRQATRWRMAPALPDSDERYYVDFDFRLDTRQLPPALKVTVADQSAWQLQVDRTIPVPEATRR